MWLVWLVIGVLAVLAWLYWSSSALCPRCGVELPKQFAAPWKYAESCRCGWHVGHRP